MAKAPTKKTASQNAGIVTDVAIGLNAVLAAVENEQPKVLCVTAEKNVGLPYGPFDPERHRTFEIGVREWVERQTNISLGFIEQLYTFGDKGREAPAAELAGRAATDRVVSVGYLALASTASDVEAKGAGWRNWYSFFPWEDWRSSGASVVRSRIIDALRDWASKASGPGETQRNNRINRAFGQGEFGWEEERTLDRYELMYEAGLVVEAARDRGEAEGPPASESGALMTSDHRRILATAIGRLRGKLKYRPVIFEMVGNEFSLLQLQRTAEAIVGFEFHKQNFRRSAENSGFIEPTGKTMTQAAGRPAALFQVNREALKDRAAGGLTIPRLRQAVDRVM